MCVDLGISIYDVCPSAYDHVGHRTNLFRLRSLSLNRDCVIFNPVLVVGLEFEESRLRVIIATGAKETLPGIELVSLALQAEALPIKLAGPGNLCQCCNG